MANDVFYGFSGISDKMKIDLEKRNKDHFFAVAFGGAGSGFGGSAEIF